MSIQSINNIRGKLKSKARLLEPIVRIGKNGFTDSVINEINRHLERENLVKIKFLKPFAEDKDKKMIAQELAEKTNSILIDRVGFIAVLYRNRNV